MRRKGPDPPGPGSGRCAAWILVAGVLGLALLSGCAAPDKMLRTWDARQQRISRGLADIVDAADRAFGEARVEDRERIVQAKIGPQVVVRTNEGTELAFPISTRIPLPALERKTNIFLQFDSSANKTDSFDRIISAIGDNKAFSAALVTKVLDVADTGIRLDLYWNDGPQTGLRPFLRWESRPDPLRLYFEQQAYYKTDSGWGGKTIVQINRILTKESFLRFGTTSEYNEELKGVDQEHRLVFRRPFFWNSYLSAELGADYNTHLGPPRRDDTINPSLSLEEQDGDAYYARLRTTGKLWFSWIEWEVLPGVYYVWHHEKPWEYGVTFTLRFIYEAYLSGGQEG